MSYFGVKSRAPQLISDIKEEYRETALEAAEIAKELALKKGKNLSAFKSSLGITQATGKMFDTLQEKQITNSNIFNIKHKFEFGDKQVSSVQMFLRNPVEKTPWKPLKGDFGMLEDMVSNTFQPSQNRVRLNPEFVKLLEDGQLIDNAGTPIKATDFDWNKTDIKNSLTDIGLIDDGTTSEEIHNLLGYTPGSKDLTSISKDFSNTVIAKGLKNLESGKVGDFYRGLKSNVPKIGPAKDPFKWQHFAQKKLAEEKGVAIKAGEKVGFFGEAVGKAAQVATVASGVYRVVEEEDAIEKVHGAVQAVSPWLIASGNPYAIGLAGLNAIWDFLD